MINPQTTKPKVNEWSKFIWVLIVGFMLLAVAYKFIPANSVCNQTPYYVTNMQAHGFLMTCDEKGWHPAYGQIMGGR